ncbi:MAG: metal-dependent transcriptional regulator [Chloroflexi bacterium]|nr:metal-dependent transcriptional regulator [Chloroflexota bacterium]
MTAGESRHRAGDLSRAAQEYLMVLRTLSGNDARITAAVVARRLGVSTQAASEMLRRLAHDGLVAGPPPSTAPPATGKTSRSASGRELHLTSAGRAAADAIFRRHALCEWLLSEIVGLGWAESDREAERLQAAISPQVEARLDDLLGHPETCPHGNPIDLETARRRPAGVPLSTIPAGERATIYRVTEEAEEDSGLLGYLEARGLRPGAAVAILARSESLDSLTLDGPLGRATLGLRPASLIRVLRGDVDAALFHRVNVSGRAVVG